MVRHRRDRCLGRYIDEPELEKAAKKLGFPFPNKEAVKRHFKEIDADGNGRITEAEFIEWWNGRNSKDFESKLRAQVRRSLHRWSATQPHRWSAIQQSVGGGELPAAPSDPRPLRAVSAVLHQTPL